MDQEKGNKLDKGKLRWSLLPFVELEEVIAVLEFGAKKYSVDNWKKVDNGYERYLDAAMRHIAEINKGKIFDEETSYTHFSHAICSLLFASWHSKYSKIVREAIAQDDGPNYENEIEGK